MRRGRVQRRPRFDGAAACDAARRGAALGVEVVALHVHHGLSPNADAWLRALRRRLRRWARARLAGRVRLRAPRRAAAARRKRRGLGAHGTLRGAARAWRAMHGADARAARPSSARPGRDAAAAGAARRRRRRARRRCRDARVRDGIDLGASLARPAARGDRRVCARAHRFATSTTSATPTRASRAIACACSVWPALGAAFPASRSRARRRGAAAQEAHEALGELAAIDLAGASRRTAPSSSRAGRGSRRPRAANALRAWLRERCDAARRQLVDGAPARSELPDARAGSRAARHVGDAAACHRGALATRRASTTRAGRMRRRRRPCDRAGRRLSSVPGWGGVFKSTRRAEAASRWRRSVALELRSPPRRRALPGRPGPPAAQPEEAVPGGGRAGMAARDGPLVYSAGATRVRAGPRHRCAVRSRRRASAQMRLDWLAASGVATDRACRERPLEFEGSRAASCRHGAIRRRDVSPWHSSSTSTAARRWARPSASATSPSASPSGRARAIRWSSCRRRMSGETNRLLDLARQLAPAQTTTPVLRELDMIASTGEQVSVGLLALALQAEGMEAVSYTGWQVPIATDSRLHQGAHREHRRRSACAPTSPPARWSSSPASRASMPTATSRRSGAAAPTPRPWRWPPR